jgi:DNA-binding transcriptional ArsR family regulator
MAKAKPSIEDIFHALGDPMRRALLDRLSRGPMSVSHLAEPFDITLTAIGQHLQILEESGLVHTEKAGRVRTCRIEPVGFDVLEGWIREHRTRWERGLDRLAKLLDEDEL